MSARRLDGVATAAAIRGELVARIARFTAARGRAPGKWDVSIEYCDTLEAAVARAAEVMDL